MTKANIVDQVASATGLTKRDTAAVVDGFLSSVIDALSTNQHVEIRGFGTFKVVKRARRVGRNPRTGEEVEIVARAMPVFKPSRALKLKINDACSVSQMSQPS